nr:hypothetical protein CFP56_12272 [Quercus suber]
MLLAQTFRRIACVHLTLGLGRSFATSTVMSSPASFTLDRTLFNQTLYTRLRDVWFQDLPSGATAATKPALQRWFGALPAAEKLQFDEQCRADFEPALLSIGPEQLRLPPFTTHEHDVAHAPELAAPFLAELTPAAAPDPAHAAATLLSLALLLDQIPRNIYRTPATLPRVYTHYDRLAFALVHAAHAHTAGGPSSSSAATSPLTFTAATGNQAHTHWLIMPLLHAEHLPSHALMREILRACERAAAAKPDPAALAMLAQAEPSMQDHLVPLQRFGRYPHRNEVLGRESSAAEREFLQTAPTFGRRLNPSLAMVLMLHVPFGEVSQALFSCLFDLHLPWEQSEPLCQTLDTFTDRGVREPRLIRKQSMKTLDLTLYVFDEWQDCIFGIFPLMAIHRYPGLISSSTSL